MKISKEIRSQFQDEYRGLHNRAAWPDPSGNRKERRRAQRMGVTQEVFDQAVALYEEYGDNALTVALAHFDMPLEVGSPDPDRNTT